jgi:hypothetical protein
MEPLSLAEEEAYLRTRAYHNWSRCIDRVTFHVMERTLQGSLQFLQQLEQLVQRVHCPETSEQEYEVTTNIEKVDTLMHNTLTQSACVETPSIETLVSQYTLQMPLTFDCRSLPVLIFQGPFLSLDRFTWMQHLVQVTQQSRPGSVCVWLRPVATEINWREEIILQCLNYHKTSPAAAAHGPTAQSNDKVDESNVSMEQFLAWVNAQQTYEDIIVFLEVVDGLEDVMHWLAENRGYQGVPFVCVLMRHSRTPCSLSSSSQGPYGFITQRFVLPSSTTLLDEIWTELVEQYQFPWYLLPPNVVQEIANNLQFHHNSFVQVIMDLKAALSQILSARGSFLVLSLFNESLSLSDRMRFLWFVLHPKGRKQATGNDTSLNELQEWLQRVEEHHMCCNVAFHLVKELHPLQQQSTLPTMFALTATNRFSNDTLTVDSRKKLLKSLAILREEATNATSLTRGRLANMMSAWHHTQQVEAHDTSHIVHTCINELIILIGNCNTFSDVYQCIDAIVTQAVTHIYTQLLRISDSADHTMTALTAQSRRHTVHALLQVDTTRTNQDSVCAVVPGILYRILQDRMSIGLNEWLTGFQNQKLSDVSDENIMMYFGYGLNVLKMLGLVNEKQSMGKGESTFKKCAIVWCSGD